MGALWHASRVSALRRELNSHKKMEPRGSALLCHAQGCRFEDKLWWHYQQIRSIKLASTKVRRQQATRPQRRCASESRRTASKKTDFSQFIGPPEATAGFVSVIAGGLKTRQASTYSAEREATVAPQQELRGPKIYSALRTAPPNPSFEARPNGKLPGPAPGEVYHPSAGPGVLPLVPPQLER